MSDDAVSVRRLEERDKSRDRGDALARCVRLYLAGRVPRMFLWYALASYRRLELGDQPQEKRR